MFYLAELVLSPIFGILSDRLGHHRVMLYGPVFGGVAVVLTGLTTNLLRPRRHALPGGRLDGGQRALDPRASSRSRRPATRSCAGKAAARFEGATLAGLGAGFIVAPKLFEALGPTAFFLNAVVLRRLVPDLPASASRTRPASARRSRPTPRRVPPLPGARPVLARLAPGADLDRGQRRRSACGSASRSSSSRRRTRTSRTRS